MLNMQFLRRTLAIYRCFSKHQVLHLLIKAHPKPNRLLQKFGQYHQHSNTTEQDALHFRLALEELGPIFIKLGQVLSTRPDLFPKAYIIELSKLQEHVQPVAEGDIRQIIESELKLKIDDVFYDFNPTPVATASMAQVHKGILKHGSWAGREVAVKVIRPNIEQQIQTDIHCLYQFARILERAHPDGRRLKPVLVVQQIEKHLNQELNLSCEAANASQLRHNFANSNLLYTPEICWDYTRKSVMVQEWIDGVSVLELDTLRALGVDIKELAKQAVEIFFTQVFRDGFFHADMHPGNIYVGTQGKLLGRFIALDCGIVGSISQEDKHHLSINFLAFFERDYRRVAQAHIYSGWVPPETSVEDLTTAIRTTCEPFFGQPIAKISLGRVLMELFDVSRQFDVAIQPQLTLLQKTLLNVEGMGRVIDPELDLWETAKPHLEKAMKQNLSLKSMVKQIKSDWPYFAQLAPQTPLRLLELIHQTRSGDTSQKMTSKQSNSDRNASKYTIKAKSIICILIGGIIGYFFSQRIEELIHFFNQ